MFKNKVLVGGFLATLFFSNVAPVNALELDEDTRTGLLQLSPELQDIYQGALIRSGMFGTQADKYTSMDPFAAADLFYQQGQPLIDKERDLRRTDMETRLLAQGRLGSSGGALEQEALETSFATADNQRRADSFTQAQNLISTLLGREKGDLGTATGLLDIPLQYANVGQGILAGVAILFVALILDRVVQGKKRV